jgi:NAD(P)-dependent dehydrogenase (short-subunit alcohol dehydrogenase family)
MLSFNFNGQIALVTGGGGGIGKACAQALVATGAQVIIADRKVDALNSVAKEIGASPEVVDIAEEISINALLERVSNIHNHIDILVNCAGNLQNFDKPEEMSMNNWDRITNVHLRGTYMMSAKFGALMARRRSGCIVTIASIAGMRSAPLHAYSPAKAALISQTECFAAEWGRSNVRVNAVSPGFVRTPGTTKGVNEGLLAPDQFSTHTAFGRWVEAHEIANTVVFLASDFASGITGVNLPVDAGWLAASPWATYSGVPEPRPLAL